MANLPAPQTVSYFGISLFSSKTFYFNVLAGIVAILAIPEVTAIIPPKYMPTILAVSAAGNVLLRMHTVRPAALIKPGDTQEIKVPRLGPPPPAPLTD